MKECRQMVGGPLKADFKALERHYLPTFALYVRTIGDLLIRPAQVWWTVKSNLSSAGGV